MYGTNGIANIIAALIVAAALVYTGGFGSKNNRDSRPAPVGENDEYAAWLTRAVGDIRTDMVVNCGCCGDEQALGERRASRSF